MANIKDKSIKDCKFLLNIIEKIRPGTVDFKKIKSGDSEEEQISKINYTIAAARKLGCQVLTLWEHINEVNPRFVSMLIAELQHMEKNQQKNWNWNLFKSKFDLYALKIFNVFFLQINCFLFVIQYLIFKSNQKAVKTAKKYLKLVKESIFL